MDRPLPCHVPGCSHPAVVHVPVAPPGLLSMAEVAAAPLAGSCRVHHAEACRRYAVTVDWALLRGLVDGPPARWETVRRICEQLAAMDVDWARSLYGTLDCGRDPT